MSACSSTLMRRSLRIERRASIASAKEYSEIRPEDASEYYRRNRKKLLEYGRKYREARNVTLSS